MSLKETILPLANRYAREYMTFKEPEARDVLIAALDAADAELFDITSMYNRCVDDVHTLRAENEKLRDALKPFARAYLNYTIENVDAARAALGGEKT